MISTPRLPRRRVIAFGLGLGLGATAVSGVLPLPVSIVVSAASIQGLSLGARGDAVAELQRALIANGVDVVGGADGVFGPKTLEALQMFQSSAGLAVSDVVADDTLIALGLIESPIAGLAEGARGEAVQVLQEALIAVGITPRGGADGIFGPGTASALREWQSASGLEASGVVDATTAARLLGGS
ncbi:MAG: peptidoglycan-binding domain-containing protein, partial [Ilumatobacteraceae bacterium]